jgi:hypothetical protein
MPVSSCASEADEKWLCSGVTEQDTKVLVDLVPSRADSRATAVRTCGHMFPLDANLVLPYIQNSTNLLQKVNYGTV